MPFGLFEQQNVIIQLNKYEKLPIPDLMPGFELKTLRLRVSFCNVMSRPLVIVHVIYKFLCVCSANG